MSTTRTVARNSLWYAIETGFGLAAAIVTSVIVARVIGPGRLGDYSYIMTMATITGSLGSVGLSVTLRRYMAEYLSGGNEEKAYGVFHKILHWQALLLGVLCTAGLIWAWSFDSDYRLVAILLVLSAWPRGMGFMPSQANMASENVAASVPGSMAGGIIQVGGTWLSLLMHWDLIGMAAAQLIGYLVEFVWKMAPHWRRVRDCRRVALEPELKRRMIKFSTQGIGLVMLSLVVWERSDVLLLKWLQNDSRQIAYFSQPFSVVEKLLLIPQTFGMSMGASLMAQQGRSRDQMAGLAVTSGIYLCLVALPLLAGAAAIAGPIWMLYGPQYVPAAAVFALLALTAIPKAAMVPAQTLLQNAEKQSRLVWWNSAGGIVKLALGVGLIPLWGGLGAAMANGAAQTLVGLGVWYTAWRMFRMPMRRGSLAKIALSAGLMGLAAWMIVRNLPPLPGAVCAVAAGVVLFPLLLRLTGALLTEDRMRLQQLAGMLPGPLGALYHRVLWLVIAR